MPARWSLLLIVSALPHPWGDREADEQTLRAEQSRDGLTPGLDTRTDEKLVALRLQLFGSGRDVIDVEFDPALRHRQVHWPLLRSEAGLRRVSERPQAEVLHAPVHECHHVGVRDHDALGLGSRA